MRGKRDEVSNDSSLGEQQLQNKVKGQLEGQIYEQGQVEVMEDYLRTIIKALVQMLMTEDGINEYLGRVGGGGAREVVKRESARDKHLSPATGARGRDRDLLTRLRSRTHQGIGH